MLHENCEEHHPNLFYVFVALEAEDQRPAFYVVPSKDVAEYAKTSNDAWNNGVKRNGQPRKATSMRAFDVGPWNEHSKDAWSILGLDKNV